MAAGPRRTDRDRRDAGGDSDAKAKAKAEESRRTGRLSLTQALAGGDIALWLVELEGGGGAGAGWLARGL